MFYVYKITNLLNNKFYIGKSKNVKKRWSKHLSTAKHKNSNDYSYIHRAINKYGENNFTIEILASYNTEEEALESEVQIIKTLQATNRNIGYNITNGGDGVSGYKPSKESREKNRQSHLGKKPTEETRKKMSKSHKGSKRTEQTKQKMREARKRQPPMSDNTKEKIRQSKIGKKVSEETKQKTSIKTRGENNPQSKLTEKDVLEIRKLRSEGSSRKELRDKFNVSFSTIDGIIYRLTWKHLK